MIFVFCSGQPFWVGSNDFHFVVHFGGPLSRMDLYSVDPFSLQNHLEEPSPEISKGMWNEAFVRDFPLKVKVEDFWSCENDAWTVSSTAAPIRPWSVPITERVPHPPAGNRKSFPMHPSSRTHFVLQSTGVRASANFQKLISCETSLTICKWKMWKRSFCARHPSKSESGRCENEAFVQDFPHNLQVEDVKTKLLCEASLKKWKWKMWKRSFCARRPSKSESGRCENEAFVRDIPQKVKVEDVKTKLLCETSLKKLKWKMWKRSFCARHPSKSESGRCENEAFVQDFLQKVKVRFCSR